MIIYKHLKRKGGTSHMIKFIKKVLVRYQRNQARQRRLNNNHKQLSLIYKGLEERA